MSTRSSAGRLIALGLLSLLAAVFPAKVVLAQPGSPSQTIGEFEFLFTGKYPRKFALNEHGMRVLLPTPRRSEVAFGFGPSISSKAPTLTLTIPPGPIANAAYPGRVTLPLADVTGKVVPIFGELYLVKYNLANVGTPRATSVVLERVGDRVDERLRPASTSRTIAVAERRVELFAEKIPDVQSTEMFFDVVDDLAFDGDAAKFTLRPTSNRGDRTNKSSRKPLSIAVKKGDLLTARGRSHRVLNVVPPQSANGFALSGWIEIANEPERADAAEEPAKSPTSERVAEGRAPESGEQPKATNAAAP